MPLPLYALALAVFVMGTSEFMLAGLLPAVATDVDVPIGTAGLLTSAFAIGMVIGAPLMAAVARRWSARPTLLLWVFVFAACHVIGALTTLFDVLLLTRVVSAIANAGFLAVALRTATSLVPPDRSGRALSVLLSGTTIATVAGVPAGGLLGTALGWRAPFWVIAALCIPAVLGILRGVPRGPLNAPARRPAAGPGSSTTPAAAPSAGSSRGPSTGSSRRPTAGSCGGPTGAPASLPAAAPAVETSAAGAASVAASGRRGGDRPGLRAELRLLATPRLLTPMVLAALVNGGTFAVFTFLAPIVTDVAGLSETWVPLALVLFGVGSFVGVTIAGRLADSRPGSALAVGGPLLLLGWITTALVADQPIPLLALVLLQGTLSFGVGTTLIARVLSAATEAPTMGGAYATVALNLGAVAGPMLGGAALSMGFGALAPVGVACALTAVALVVMLLSRRALLGTP